MNKSFKILLKFFIFLGLALGLGTFLFFYFTDAPILKGEVEFSIKYKPKKLLDLYLPTTEVYEKIPVVVFYHGGAWIVGRKESVNNARFNAAFNALRAKGYAIVSPEYALGKFGKSPFPECIDDAIDALNWIGQNQKVYNFDMSNVGIFGESAGAHLALLVAFADNETSARKPDFPLQYVVDVYGPTDLDQLYLHQKYILDSIQSMIKALPDAVERRLDLSNYLFGFDPNQDSLKAKEFVEIFSPQCHISPTDLPILIIHGKADRLVPIDQSQMLLAYLDLCEIPFEYHFMDGVDHGFIGATNDQKKNVQNWIVQFICENYANQNQD